MYYYCYYYFKWKITEKLFSSLLNVINKRPVHRLMDGRFMIVSLFNIST